MPPEPRALLVLGGMLFATGLCARMLEDATATVVAYLAVGLTIGVVVRPLLSDADLATLESARRASALLALMMLGLLLPFRAGSDRAAFSSLLDLGLAGYFSLSGAFCAIRYLVL